MTLVDGYLALVSILRNKAPIFNLDVYHVLMEFLGIDFIVPE